MVESGSVGGACGYRVIDSPIAAPFRGPGRPPIHIEGNEGSGSAAHSLAPAHRRPVGPMRSSEVEPSSWKRRVRRIRDKGSIENQLPRLGLLDPESPQPQQRGRGHRIGPECPQLDPVPGEVPRGSVGPAVQAPAGDTTPPASHPSMHRRDSRPRADDAKGVDSTGGVDEADDLAGPDVPAGSNTSADAASPASAESAESAVSADAAGRASGAPSDNDTGPRDAALSGARELTTES